MELSIEAKARLGSVLNISTNSKRIKLMLFDAVLKQTCFALKAVKMNHISKLFTLFLTTVPYVL